MPVKAIKPATPDTTVDVEWSARSREANLETVLKRGSRGAVVARLQARLARLGYAGSPIDGDFGSKTQAAVMQFQDAHGLVADGVVEASSWAKLNSEIAQLGQVPLSQTRRQRPIQPERSSLPSSTTASTAIVSTALQPTVTASTPNTNLLSQKTGWIVILVIVQGAGWLAILQGLNKELMLLTGRSLFPGKRKQWLFSFRQ
jgi:peptidoglycan hydrolase-like protein with peptidoglycan-binding domain